MAKNILTIRDHRTGKEYELPVDSGSIRALELRQIKESEDDFGLITYDPGFSNTASCRSRITYIDGRKGILRYRGYPIEQLAGRVSFLEVAYLIFNGELPDQAQKQAWVEEITGHAEPAAGVQRVVSAFSRDSVAMAMLMSSFAALGGFHPASEDMATAASRRPHLLRLIGNVPALSAWIYRHKMGLPFVPSQAGLSYSENFLHMTFERPDGSFDLHPVFAQALDVLFVLHADHEQNCSANAMRSVGSSKADPYLSASAAVGALAGPLHGGANEAVLRMLNLIGSREQVASHIEKVKQGRFRLMGFGHRVYKNYDPRAKIIKKMADEVLEVAGSSPLLDVARELERIALQDDYFVSRKLYPNVDFYSGLIYQAIGFPSWMFPVLFALARTSGWVSQWEEMVSDPEQRIARPRQLYEGPAKRDVGS